MKTFWVTLACIAASIALTFPRAAPRDRPASKEQIGLGDPALIDPVFMGDTTVFVENSLPVFINGRRLDAVDGGHTITVSQAGGIVLDGVVYIPPPEHPLESHPARPEDGFRYYLSARAAELAGEALVNGASAAQARRIMLDFWAQHSDSVDVVAGEWSADVTYGGDRLIVQFPTPIPDGPTTGKSAFEPMLSWAEELAKTLATGHLLLKSGACTTTIRPEDAMQALSDIDQVAARAEVWGQLGGDTVYKGFPVVDGKYRLCPTMVGDLVRAQKEPQGR